MANLNELSVGELVDWAEMLNMGFEIKSGKIVRAFGQTYEPGAFKDINLMGEDDGNN